MKNNLFIYDIKDKNIIKDSEPITDDEKTLLKILMKNFGEFTTIPEISKKLKISRSSLYAAKAERKFVSYIVGGKIIILTKTLINFMKTFEDSDLSN